MAKDRMVRRAGASAWAVLFPMLLFVALFGPGMAGTALAARDRFVLDFHDSHIRSQRGESSTLFLKKTLREQYPWVEVDDLDLRRVVLIAKSRHGRGEAQLRVGHRMTGIHPVYGRPAEFGDDRRYTFDRVSFSNPSHDSNGPWQIDLQGNFIVRKVVLEVDQRQSRRMPPPRPYRF